METTMDITKYLGSAFLRVGDVKVNGPIRMVIESVTEGKFDKPDLTFDDGTRLSLNVTNTRTLARAYGTDGAGWIGKEIELYLGETEYEGKRAAAARPLAANPSEPRNWWSSEKAEEEWRK